MENDRGGGAVSASAKLSSEDLRECFDALVEELGTWAFQREKMVAKLDLRGARRARKAASALRMLHYMLEDGAAYDDAVATILGECHALLSSVGPVEAEAASRASEPAPDAAESPAPEQSGRRQIGGIVRLHDEEDDELDDIDKTAPGLPRGVLESYLAEVRSAAS